MAYAQKRGKAWCVYIKLPTKPVKYRCVTTPPGASEPFRTKTSALSYGREEETRINAGTWVDPRHGQTLWGAWWEQWAAANDVDEATAHTYSDLWRTHIAPRYADQPIASASLLEVEAWLKLMRAGEVETGPPGRRRTRAYAPRTTDAIRKLMKMMLDDAVVAKMIAANPLAAQRSRNRGRRTDRVAPQVRPKLGAEPEQVLAAAVNMHQVVGPGSVAGIGAFMRVLTAGWMGMRPGEQSALARNNCWLGAGVPAINVHSEEGNYEELPGTAPRLKSPKGGLGRLTVAPLGYAALLAAWLDYVDGDIVFPGPRGGRWARRAWDYRWDQAATGGVLRLRGPSRYAPAGEYVLERAAPGLEYKGLRRAHNVWLTEIGVAEVARAYRLGHAMSDDMQGAYSMVSATLERQLLAGLQELWARAFAGFAGVAALGIIRQFSPEYADSARAALGSARPGIDGAQKDDLAIF
jgi:hypothetical protein